jgi:hypothetical protein
VSRLHAMLAAWTVPASPLRAAHCCCARTVALGNPVSSSKEPERTDHAARMLSFTCGGRQFSVGRSSRSITRTSIWVVDGSSFSPSCSCKAVKIEGAPLGTDSG